jgi:hypothetical protein
LHPPGDEVRPGVTTREARVDDIASLAHLATQLGYPTTPEEAERRAKGILGQPGHKLLVAEVDREVVGWIHVM